MYDWLLSITDMKLLGINLIDSTSLFALLLRFMFNFLVTSIIIKFFYLPNSKRKEYVFPYVLISAAIFLLIFMLGAVKIKIGIALGLFAIFGIIRYRTRPVPIKEMTYLFILITISVINGMVSDKISYAEIIATNSIMIFVTYMLERLWQARKKISQKIRYEKIDLIKPEKRRELIEDLENRTGLKIASLDIREIDFLRDIAIIKIYYDEKENPIDIS